MLVIDATVALAAASVPSGFQRFIDADIVAPPLLWSETRSVLHEAARRGDLSAANARRIRRVLDSAPIGDYPHPRLGEEAWDVADRLRLQRTFAAEYIALARLLGCPLVTLDARLAQKARRLVIVREPRDVVA